MDATVDALAAFLARHPRLFVLTGAGCSTDSGIPDYRDGDGEWKRARPVMYQDFVSSEYTRKRYWGRSLVGFRRMGRAVPNDAHLALAALEQQGHVLQLVTQNVDGLHQAAGSRDVIDLHGRIDTVRCLGCERRSTREALQHELIRRNPAFAALDAGDAPDGDADLEHRAFETFDVPACPTCGGLLKPDVVFFGEGVPSGRVERAMHAVDTADAMLVVGSSLMVYSGFRFAKAAAERGKPIAAVNLGRTRADHLLALKVSDNCGSVLRRLLGCTRRPSTEPRPSPVGSPAAVGSGAGTD
ncbi:MAG: NAD-dependent protein deacetylase [Acidobacteria bacterium]|nr:NAD-dependent protein deacetylase [Acidobacteriota bacterium]